MIVTLLILFAITQAGQDFDYGKPAELRGLTKIYVYTDLDISSRNAIIKEIEKKIPGLVIVDRREEAELWLIYTQDARRDFCGVIGSQTDSAGSSSSTATPVYGKTISGVGYVVRPSATGKRDRVLMDFRDEKRSILSSNLTKRFAGAFIKAYKEANK